MITIRNHTFSAWGVLAMGLGAAVILASMIALLLAVLAIISAAT